MNNLTNISEDIFCCKLLTYCDIQSYLNILRVCKRLYENCETIPENIWIDLECIKTKFPSNFFNYFDKKTFLSIPEYTLKGFAKIKNKFKTLNTNIIRGFKDRCSNWPASPYICFKINEKDWMYFEHIEKDRWYIKCRAGLCIDNLRMGQELYLDTKTNNTNFGRYNTFDEDIKTLQELYYSSFIKS